MKAGNLVRFYPSFIHTGGGERARTDGLLRARQALSQLSYTPNSNFSKSGTLKRNTQKPYGGPGWNRTIDLTLIRRAL